MIAALLLPGTALAQNKAGVASVDATWHVGASAGQFSDEAPPISEEAVDPHLHTTKKRISDGVALRTSTRALVVEDGQGDRVAIVAHDLYLAQDLLLRRLNQLVAADPSLKLGAEDVAMTASHNHNTPYYSTPGWGTAIFQDVYDLRFYDYMARQMLKAVKKAAKDLRPVRMGGATRTFNEIQSHTYGPKVADDGTPAGQPYDHTTKQLSVVAFEDISNPKKPKPYANWVVFGVHPEWTWGYDLINGDITHAAARMVDRDLGTTSVFSQRETGASGPHKDERVHKASERREFQDNGFGQLDRGARLLADGIKATLKDIRTGTPERETAYQPWTSDFDVDSVSLRFAPPATRPMPGVSNCNTHALFHGDPRIPILGLPDCQSNGAFAPLAGTTGPLYEQLKEAGVPIPETYSATALTAVEETAAVHLMAIRLGGIGVTVCPCEQFTDTALNIESRLDKEPGNLWNGYDWFSKKTPAGRDWCVPAGDGLVTCADPRNPGADLAPVREILVRRAQAQINNDATGWETDLATLGSEAEPADPALIKGNFTHEELTGQAYNLVLAVGMGNDYWGYTPEYREMRSHDHYRKALNGLGPHGADYLATRLSRMAASLNGGAPVQQSPLDLAYTAEQVRAEALARGLGEAATAYRAVYGETLPQDGGEPAVVTQPKNLTRFDGATISWIGGSNYVDLPDVRVERKRGGKWRRFGDMTGETQIMVRFPKPDQLTAWRTGAFEWTWTAAFEAFSSDIAQPDLRGRNRRRTPAGDYRFVIRGKHRGAGTYRLVSDVFTVSPWGGVTVSDLRVEDDGHASFAAPVVDYPDTWKSPFRFIDGTREKRVGQEYCTRCSFRPWADFGTLSRAEVSGVEAKLDDDGRWRTVAPISGDAVIAPGDLRTKEGETNAEEIR